MLQCVLFDQEKYIYIYCTHKSGADITSDNTSSYFHSPDEIKFIIIFRLLEIIKSVIKLFFSIVKKKNCCF